MRHSHVIEKLPTAALSIDSYAGYRTLLQTNSAGCRRYYRNSVNSSSVIIDSFGSCSVIIDSSASCRRYYRGALEVVGVMW